MSFLRKLFGLGPKADFRALIKEQKAQIIDVRTPAEFKSGHIRNSINVPLGNIQNAGKKIKSDRPIILCCASGMRSGQATRMLKAKGVEAYNGGSWTSVKQYV